MEVITDQNWLLSLGTFLPLAGVLVMLFIPKREELLLKQVALVTAAATFARRHRHPGPVRLRPGREAAVLRQHRVDQAIQASYTIGLDGISLPLYMLSMVITLLVMIYSWDHIPTPGTPRRSSS